MPRTLTEDQVVAIWEESQHDKRGGNEAAILASAEDRGTVILRTNEQPKIMFGYDDVSKYPLGMIGMLVEDIMPKDEHNYRVRHRAGIRCIYEGNPSTVMDKPLHFHGLRVDGTVFRLCLWVRHFPNLQLAPSVICYLRRWNRWNFG